MKLGKREVADLVETVVENLGGRRVEDATERPGSHTWSKRGQARYADSSQILP